MLIYKCPSSSWSFLQILYHAINAMIINKCLALYFQYDSPWRNSRMIAIKCWLENMIAPNCKIISKCACCRSLQVSLCRTFLNHCRLFQVVVGCFRSFLACFKSYQVVSWLLLVILGCFRSFLACRKLFQVVLSFSKYNDDSGFRGNTSLRILGALPVWTLNISITRISKLIWYINYSSLEE